MAKIYTAPKHIKQPLFDNWEAEEKRYLNEIRSFLKENGIKGTTVGKVLSFPAADSAAYYMSAGGSKLIHLEIGDGWDYPYAYRLTAADIKQQLRSQEALSKIDGAEY